MQRTFVSYSADDLPDAPELLVALARTRALPLPVSPDVCLLFSRLPRPLPARSVSLLVAAFRHPPAVTVSGDCIGDSMAQCSSGARGGRVLTESLRGRQWQREIEIVLFIGTRFSNLYTSVHTPA
jgi:hypothetical protein